MAPCWRVVLKRKGGPLGVGQVLGNACQAGDASNVFMSRALRSRPIDKMLHPLADSEKGANGYFWGCQWSIWHSAQQHSNGRWHFFMTLDSSARPRHDGKRVHAHELTAALLEDRVHEVG